MILTGNPNPQKWTRSFPRMTRLSLQIRGGFNVFIGHDQGEVQNGSLGITPDALLLNQASTSPPYDFWWVGELWYATSIAGAQFSIVIVGESSD